MNFEQQINLKFLVRLEKTPTKTFKLLQEVCGDATRFKERREDVKDDPKSRRPTTSSTNENVERVREKVRSDCHLTVRMIANDLSINRKRGWRIITKDLGMRKICAKMVPSLLNDGQKEHGVQVYQDILKRLETEPDLLSRVVTSDDSWIFENNPLIKRKSASSPRPKKAKLFKSKIKVMLIVFFDVHKIVHF